MFFILHAEVCGKSLPHHGHSHEGGHGHSHSSNRNHSRDENHDDTDTIINADPLVADIVTGQDREHVLRAKSSKNINVRAAIIHVIGDFVQSIGVLCAAILIHFKVYFKITKRKLIISFFLIILA